ncbi:MAG TPA: carbohydrate ABC transporter permease [Chloroflexota bacterium]|jgi:multiple sugar transport system permease protein|nr:carbohydrate ABC transporter permease [Chloroflexota bacterium]
MVARSGAGEAAVVEPLPAPRRSAARRRARVVALRRAGMIGRHLLLILVAIPFIVPFYWLVISSFKTNGDLQSLPPTPWPHPWTLVDMQSALGVSGFWDYVRNTTYITIFNVVATVVSSAIIAYPFARIRFPGRDVLFALVLVTLILPPWTTLIPTYYLYKWIGWLGTLRPLTWPALTGNSFFIFLLRQFMMTIPYDLSDSARIDGCSEYRIFYHIILPLIKPALATTALFTFLWTYNDFFNPLIFLNDPSNYTLSLGVYQFVINHGVANIGAIMAYCLILTVPPVVLFFFAQRTMIRGVTMSGLKF